MANMRPEQNKMPTLAADIRNKNFDEVALGYTPEMARAEAARCLHCKHQPCVNGCPVQVPIPQFIEKIAAGDFRAAYQLLTTANALPAVCGRVCPQEKQCEAKCVRRNGGKAVAIGNLERFAADQYLAQAIPAVEKPRPNGKKIAVVGSGPSSLACAGDLARLGYGVTIFEALHQAGGVLSYGIPAFRLPKKIVAQEIARLTALGVEIQTNIVIGKTLFLDELLEELGFSAVFLGTGAGLPRFPGIPGEDLAGVFAANEYLTRINLMQAQLATSDTPLLRAQRVAVIGGGNVAMDAARCAKRLGAEQVSIVYRRSAEEMPARAEEVQHAKEEGIVFHLLRSPVRILDDGNGRACGVECAQMALGEADADGRRQVAPIAGAYEHIAADAVIFAIGTSPNPILCDATEGLSCDRRGCLRVQAETMETTKKGVYAGGDAVTGAATVILAMGAGKKAAAAIHQALSAADAEKMRQQKK